MQLCIIDNQGVVHVVADRIERYDLTRPLARVAVVDDVAATLTMLRHREVAQPRRMPSGCDRDTSTEE